MYGSCQKKDIRVISALMIAQVMPLFNLLSFFIHMDYILVDYFSTLLSISLKSQNAVIFLCALYLQS